MNRPAMDTERTSSTNRTADHPATSIGPENLRMSVEKPSFLRRCTYDAVALPMVLAYYFANRRNAGLAGPESLGAWRERLGGRTAPFSDERPLWVHSAGPGDALAGIAFVRSLWKTMPTLPVFMSYGTRGAKAAIEKALDAPSARHCSGWLPFDLSFPVRRALRHIRPLAFVNMQGEFWPTLLPELRRLGIPNVALRVDAFDWTQQTEFPQWTRPLYQHMISHVDLFSTRHARHIRHLVQLGIPEERIALGEDYRVELLPSVGDGVSEARHPLHGMPHDQTLVVLAGLRPDELDGLAPLLDNTRQQHGLRYLVSVTEMDALPHTERVLSRHGLRCARRSRLSPHDGDWNAILLDTHGELFGLYARANAAIIGDTFPPGFGTGRNFWEPLWQGVPIIHGPLLDLPAALQTHASSGYIHRVTDYSEVPTALRDLLARNVPRGEVHNTIARLRAAHRSGSEMDAHLVCEFLATRNLVPSPPTEAVEPDKKVRHAYRTESLEPPTEAGKDPAPHRTTERPHLTPKPNDPAHAQPRILIVRLSSIGDVVRVLPAAVAIRKALPHARIDWAIGRLSADVVLGHPAIDHVFVWNPPPTRTYPALPFMRYCRALRNNRYDYVFDFHAVHWESALVTAFSGAPVRYGFPKDRCRELSHLFTNAKITLPETRANLIDEFRALSAALAPGIDIPDTSIAVGDDETRYVDEYLEAYVHPGTPLIAMHVPVAQANHQDRQWPLPNFARLADLLLDNQGLDVMLTWGPSQRASVDEVRAAMRHTPLLGPEPKGLKHYAHLIRRASLYVGNDTGPMHIASLMGTPVVAIFGESDPVIHGPGRMPSVTLSPRVHAASGTRGCQRLPLDAWATPEEVHAACLELLSNSEKTSATVAR